MEASSADFVSAEKGPWYADGLVFACSRCGDCCTGAPGYVWVGAAEIERLARETGLGTAEFTRRYVRQVGPRLSLIERANGDCVFWESDRGCTVYEARPTQCRTWPFWRQNVATPERWAETCAVCPGSGQGRLYSVDEIGRALEEEGD